MNPRKKTCVRPSAGERCAYPQKRALKRAALLFDRICVPTWRDAESVPASLKIDLPDYDQKDTTWEVVRDELFAEYKKSKLRENRISDTTSGILADDLIKFVDEFEVRLWVEQFRLTGYVVTPVYDTEQRFASDYQHGNAITYQAALENIPEIIEDLVTWEHVVEFRNDVEATRKYRQLRLWLEGALTAQSIDHARDLIAQKIDDYEWAIRKHGLMTATGALSSVLGWNGLLSIGAGMGIGGAIGGPLWSAFTASMVITGKVSVYVAERLIEKEAIQHSQDSAVAIICDAKRLKEK